MASSLDLLKIRQIGAPQLHVPCADVDVSDCHTIEQNLTIMTEAVIHAAGVGIACNQCAAIETPIRMFLSGVFDKASKEKIEGRYPGESAPEAVLMLNPKILCYGEEWYYPANGEGCLSVGAALKGKVKRSKSVKVCYQDKQGHVVEKKFDGFEAHIIQHESDHLQGVVFLEKIFDDCTEQQKGVILGLVEAEIERRGSGVGQSAAGNTDLVFDRKGDEVIFDENLLSAALRKLQLDTVLGIKARLDKTTMDPCVGSR